MSKLTISLLVILLIGFGAGKIFYDQPIKQKKNPEKLPDGYEYPTKGNSLVEDKEATPFKIICDQEKRAQFIVDCARAANPMSDEEGEDLVAQCEKTSTNLYCVKQYLSEEVVDEKTTN